MPLQFNTDLLRQKHELDDSAFSSFIGPALGLKMEVPNVKSIKLRQMQAI